jgi:hypothetical protein
MEENKSERSIGWLVEEIMKGSVEKNRNRQEQELIRRGEFRDRTERLVRNLMVEELSKAREEGYKKGREDQQHLDGLLYGTTVATTTTLEEGWILKHKKKVEEELSKLTTK